MIRKGNKLTVGKSVLIDVWGLPYKDSPADGVSIIKDTIIGQNRWTIRHKLIIKLHDEYWETTYLVGSTEYQEETHWEYETDVIFNRVIPVDTVVTVYNPAKD